jgi:hypothetical protein
LNIDGLRSAAMLLSFDVAAEAQAEHDDWHSYEHLPERLAIPGFLRGSRWRMLAGGPGYYVTYEVGDCIRRPPRCHRDRRRPWPRPGDRAAHVARRCALRAMRH